MDCTENENEKENFTSIVANSPWMIRRDEKSVSLSIHVAHPWCYASANHTANHTWYRGWGTDYAVSYAQVAPRQRGVPQGSSRTKPSRRNLHCWSHRKRVQYRLRPVPGG